MFFEEVRILKGLTQREFKVESLESKGTRQDAEKSGYRSGLVHVFPNTPTGSGQAPDAEEAKAAEAVVRRVIEDCSRMIYGLSTTLLVPFEWTVEKCVE
jgi:hypothetical protein